MTALARHAFDGEILGRGATVRVVGSLHPLQALRGDRIDIVLPAGLSLTEILQAALAGHPELRTRRDFVLQIDGHGVNERLWHRIRIKPGVTVTFRPRLQNGSLRTVFSLVLAVAAIIVAGPLGGTFAASALGTAIGISAGVASALIAGGIILAGTLALNALFPVAPPKAADASSPLNSIQGAQNQANPFGVIPVVLGRSRQSPYYAAKPYTEIVGDDQYLRLLFCLGYGPLLIEDIRIGETPLTSFASYTIEQRQGFVADAATTLYPGEVDEQALSIELATGGVQNRQTTAAETDEIWLDYTAPQGIAAVDPQGDDVPITVLIKVRYRIAGAVPWTQGPDRTFTRSVSPSRLGLQIVVARGQYEVEVSNQAAARDPKYNKDQVIWTALRSMKKAPPIAFAKPLALLSLRIKASDQLSGVIATLNCITTSLVKAWSGTTWVADTASQWPPDLFRHVLQGAANARPVADALIDLAGLQAWWSYCVANGFKMNAVINSPASVYDQLVEIAAAGRAVVTFVDGKWGVIWDRPADSIVQHFTPRNSWGFQGQKPYTQQPHGWRVSFINERNGFTVDERIVYDDGYSAANATLFEGIKFPGVTDPDLIWKHGRFHIAQSRLRPEKITINAGWDNLVCTRGDRVAVTHDVLLIGLASGRVKSVAGQVVTFDETVTIEAGKTYGLSFRLAAGTSPIVRALNTTAAGDYNSLTLVGDLTGIAAEPGGLFAFGETDREYAVYRVQAIAHQKDLIATLTLVDDAPGIATADFGAIPAYNPNVTIPADLFTLSPRDFRFAPAVDGQGNSIRAITRLSWAAARRGHIVASELQTRQGDQPGTDWARLAVVPWPQFTLDVPLISPGVWSFRVRFLFEDNDFSSWTEISYVTLLGFSGVPDDVQNIRASAYVDSNVSIAWDEVVDYRPVRYAVRKGDTWASGLELGTIAHPPFAAHGNGTYLVKAYVGSDLAKTYSVNAAICTIAGSSLVSNVVAVRDEAANGWAGVFGGTVAKAGPLIRTGGSSDILSSPDFLSETDLLNKGGQGNGSYEIDPSRYINAGRVAPCRVTITWKGTGQTTSDNMLSNPDFLNNPDLLASSSTDLVEVYPEISFAQNSLIGDIFNIDPVHNPANDPFAEPDIFSANVSFSPWIKYEPGIYVGQYFRARLVLKTSDPQVVAIALAFTLTVDVPDRVDSWALVAGLGTSLNQVTVPSSGLVIVFASNGKVIAEAFNGGPGTDAVPLVQITNTSSQAFDFEVQSLTTTGCTIVPRLAGVPTDAPKTNISIQGW